MTALYIYYISQSINHFAYVCSFAASFKRLFNIETLQAYRKFSFFANTVHMQPRVQVKCRTLRYAIPMLCVGLLISIQLQQLIGPSIFRCILCDSMNRMSHSSFNAAKKFTTIFTIFTLFGLSMRFWTLATISTFERLGYN